MWKPHTYCCLGGLGLTLEDVLSLMALPLYGETKAVCTMFEGEDEEKLQWLIATVSHSKATSSSKSTYVSWIPYFDEGKGSHSGLVLEALLAYWLSWFILRSASEMA